MSSDNLMKMTIEVEVEPFEVPAYVVTKNPPKERGEGRRFRLQEIDHKTLALLCRQFRRDVFKRAGKPDPGD